MPRPTALGRTLAALERALAGRRWYLFGAQALAVWGAPRTTSDVDVTVETGDADAGQLVRALQAQGLRLRVPAAEADAFVARTRVLPLLHAGTRLPVDVVLAGSGLEDEFLARRRMVAVAGTLIPVISPEDLVVSKLLAGRPRDVEDVRAIVASQAELDAPRVVSLLGELEEALGQTDLLAQWAAIWTARPGAVGLRPRSPRRPPRT